MSILSDNLKLQLTVLQPYIGRPYKPTFASRVKRAANRVCGKRTDVRIERQMTINKFEEVTAVYVSYKHKEASVIYHLKVHAEGVRLLKVEKIEKKKRAKAKDPVETISDQERTETVEAEHETDSAKDPGKKISRKAKKGKPLYFP